MTLAVRGRRLHLAWNGVFAGLLLAAIALGWWRLAPDPDPRPEAHSTADADLVLGTAAEDAVALLSYDAAHVETQLRTVAARLTGPFQREFARLARRIIVPAALQHGITTRAEVVGQGLVSMADDEAQVLLFVDQRTTSDSQPGPRIAGSRLRITLKLVEGTWRISGFTPL